MAEHIYRILLLLYPAEHRQAFGSQMLLHARDMEREARQRGSLQLLWLFFRLVDDGIRNAGIEQMEALMRNNRLTPAPWPIVLLAAIPGILIVLERSNINLFNSLPRALFLLGLLAFLAISIPLTWIRQRRLPAWLLLPAGFLFWQAVFLTGVLLLRQLNIAGFIDPRWVDDLGWVILLQAGLAVLLFVVLLRGQRLPLSVWLALGALLLVNLLAFRQYVSEFPVGRYHAGGLPQILTFAFNGSIDGLMLVAFGILAVRKHGLLALLVIIGGYSYMCMDSDYISAFRLNEWAGYTAYVLGMYALYLIVTPVAMLRARTRQELALAVFIPVGLFMIGRIAVPWLVLPGPPPYPWGDMLISINVMLSLVLGWFLYGHLSENAEKSPSVVESSAEQVRPASETSSL